MKNKAIFLLGGTSSLGLEFMWHIVRKIQTPTFSQNANIKIFAFIRPAEKQSQMLNRRVFTKSSYLLDSILKTVNYDGTDDDLYYKLLCEYDEQKKLNSQCSLINFSTNSFVNIFKLAQSRNIPTLIIGSGAVVDWAAGRLKINDYVEGKLRAERESTTTIHPGFYIKDTPNDKASLFPWHGLHLETYKWLFSEKFDVSKDWGKKYYITKISDMLTIIWKWIDNPEKYRGHFSVGSYKPIYRYEIRELSGLTVPKEIRDKFASAQVENIYEHDMEKTENKFEMNFAHSSFDIKNAKEWTLLYSKEFVEFEQLINEKN